MDYATFIFNHGDLASYAEFDTVDEANGALSAELKLLGEPVQFGRLSNKEAQVVDAIFVNRPGFMACVVTRGHL